MSIDGQLAGAGAGDVCGRNCGNYAADLRMSAGSCAIIQLSAHPGPSAVRAAYLPGTARSSHFDVHTIPATPSRPRLLAQSLTTQESTYTYHVY